MKLLKIILIFAVAVNISTAQEEFNQFNKFQGKNWYGIYMQNSKIGFGFIESFKEHRSWKSNTEMTLSFLMNQTEATISFSEKRIYSNLDGNLVYNKFTSKNDTGEIMIDGERRGNKYMVMITVSGHKTIKKFDLPVETLSDVLKLEMLAASGKLKTGDQFEIQTFASEPPMTGPNKHILTVEEQKQMIFGGVATDVFVVRDSMSAYNISASIIIDQSGNILQQGFTSLGLVMKSEPEELAKQLEASYDLLTNNIINVSNGPENPRVINKAKYLISGYDISLIPRSGCMDINGFASDSAEINIEREAKDSYNLVLPITNKDYEEFLKPAPLIQSDNEIIIKLFKQIIADERNAFKAAKLINDWVYKNIRKEFSPDISNALQTFKSGRGDCGEHAALATALLRAAGIPSRIVSGVAYWPHGEGFAFHAWVEAYVGEWIQMDPTWGETFADATHIMLARGSENQVGPVLKALSGLKIKFLNYE